MQGMVQLGLHMPGPSRRHPRWSPEPGRAAPGCSIPHLRGGCEKLMVFKKREGSHQPGPTRPLQKPLGAPQGWPRSPLPFLGRAALFFPHFSSPLLSPLAETLNFNIFVALCSRLLVSGCLGGCQGPGGTAAEEAPAAPRGVERGSRCLRDAGAHTQARLGHAGTVPPR